MGHNKLLCTPSYSYFFPVLCQAVLGLSDALWRGPNYFWTAPQLERCLRTLDAAVVCYGDRTVIISSQHSILRLPRALSFAVRQQATEGRVVAALAAAAGLALDVC
jgi:hypothetical protein